MKKTVCLLAALLLMLSLCACGDKKPAAEESSTESGERIEAAADYYLDKSAVEIVKNKVKLCTYNGDDYFTGEYNGKPIVYRNANGGRIKILFEYESGVGIEFFPETFARSGGSALYYTRLDSTKTYNELYMLYLPSQTSVKLVSGPCSNFVVADMPESYEMYAYGCIVTPTQINVISLVDGSISAQYSKTAAQLSSYREIPEAFFETKVGGAYTATSIKDEGDRKHIRVTVANCIAGGKQTSSSEFLFTPALGVAVAV